MYDDPRRGKEIYNQNLKEEKIMTKARARHILVFSKEDCEELKS